MNNADMPAMPQDYALWCESIGNCPTLATGLTKREYFAAMAMQGILVNMGRNRFDSIVQVTEEAVKAADALLKELDK